MSAPSLQDLLSQLRAELEQALPASVGSLDRVSFDLALVAHYDSGSNRLRFVPMVEGEAREPQSAAAHRVVLDWRPKSVGVTSVSHTAVTSVTGPQPARSPEITGLEAGGGGDPGTLRRRLEMVLGGPPGFSTGARAEILADLLAEFGRPELLTVLRRDWITQFDTGPEASASVTRPPPSTDV